MYQMFYATGTLASQIKSYENDSIFLVKTVKAYTDKAGAVKSATANMIVRVSGKYGDALVERLNALIKPDVKIRLSVRGVLVGNENGNPVVREEEKRGTYTVFDVKAFSVKILGTVLPDVPVEDEMTLVLAGNLGKDPDMRYMPDGSAVTNGSLATNSAHKVGDENVKETIWWRIAVWGKQAENFAKFLRKGSKVLVEGAPVFDPETGGPKLWESTDGSLRASFEVTAFSFKMLDKKSDGPAVDYQGSFGDSDGGYSGGGSSDDEEIPF